MKVIFNGVKVLRDDSANIVDWDYEQPGGFTRTTMNEFLSKLKGRIDRYDAYDETPDELDAGYKVDAELFTELGEKLHSLWW
ncbi:MAG: hypothetical protein LBS17_03475 [Actinomycetes bacterium]|nr:hypothetical protein [Actinomycetes bacterium]